MSVSSESTSTATRIARSALLVIGILALGKAFALVEKWIGLDRFGVGTDWDTFTAANQLPSQLFILISGGALSYAFIPVFGAVLGKDRDRAWKLASNVVNTVFLAAVFLSAVVFLAAPWLIAHVIAPGFADRPELVAQTTSLMRILLLALILFAVSGLVSGVLHTHQSFLWPALAPIMYDVGNLIGVAFLARRFGIYGAAYGAVLGAGMHFLIQVPGLIRYRARWTPTLNWRDENLREVIGLMIPRAIGLFLANLNLLVAISIASGLETGSAAAFDRGYALMQLPQTLIGTAMGIVIFPTLALLSAAGDLKGKRSAMSGALRFILIASIPAAAMMIVAGRSLVGVLEGGAFDPAGADRVFAVLQLFALGIITQSGVEIVARSFYADKDVLVPLATQFVTVILNALLALLFVKLFQVAGLGLANSIAVGVECLILLAVLRRRWHGIEERTILTSTVKALIATGVMAAAMLIVGIPLDRLSLSIDRRLLLIFHAGVQIGVGLVVYLAVAYALRMEEIRQLPALMLRRRAAAPESAAAD